MRFFLLGPVFLALTTSCNDDDGDGADTDTPPDTGPIVATVAASPHVPAVALVSFTGEGDAFVEYGLAGAFDHVTPTESGATDHTIAVIGLEAGKTWDWRAVLVDSDGNRRESAPGTFAVPPPPVPVTLDTALTTGTFDGWLLVSVVDFGEASWVGFIDADGDWVWWVESLGNGIISNELGNDGRSIVFAEFGPEAVDTGHLVRVSMDGRTRTETRVVRGHHDFVEHADDGTFAFVSFEPHEIDGVTWGGDTIRVGPEGMTDADDPGILFDTIEDVGIAPSEVCDHVEEGNKLGITGVVEWSHGNSLVYLPAENAYYLLARYTDWLLKIDATTGDVIWHLNGSGAYAGDFTRLDGQLWSHPHLSELWDGGALVFDNGDHYAPPKSRVVEVSWDETAMTANIVRTIERPGSLFASAVGDTRRLPDGRIATAWGNLSDVTIHSTAGDLEWRATIPDGLFAARIRHTPDLYVLADDG
jgi:hypothetical protein